MSNKLGFPLPEVRPKPRHYALSTKGLRSLRANIQRTRPWKKSTGPKTQVGKARVAGNALKHGARSAAIIALQKLTSATIKDLRGAARSGEISSA